MSHIFLCSCTSTWNKCVVFISWRVCKWLKPNPQLKSLESHLLSVSCLTASSNAASFALKGQWCSIIKGLCISWQIADTTAPGFSTSWRKLLLTSDLLRGRHGVGWKWGFLSGLMVVASPRWRSSIIKEAVLQGDKCHLPTVHTGGVHVGLLWSSKRLERRVVVMPHWADCSLSVCGQSRARDILLILQHSRS